MLAIPFWVYGVVALFWIHVIAVITVLAWVALRRYRRRKTFFPEPRTGPDFPVKGKPW